MAFLDEAREADPAAASCFVVVLAVGGGALPVEEDEAVVAGDHLADS